jgi:hypothetical protein
MEEDFIQAILNALGGTFKHILPIILVLGFFQAVAIRKKIQNLPTIAF